MPGRPGRAASREDCQHRRHARPRRIHRAATPSLSEPTTRTGAVRRRRRACLLMSVRYTPEKPEQGGVIDRYAGGVVQRQLIREPHRHHCAAHRTFLGLPGAEIGEQRNRRGQLGHPDPTHEISLPPSTRNGVNARSGSVTRAGDSRHDGASGMVRQVRSHGRPSRPTPGIARRGGRRRCRGHRLRGDRRFERQRGRIDASATGVGRPTGCMPTVPRELRTEPTICVVAGMVPWSFHLGC
jgi:hypothetical protein